MNDSTFAYRFSSDQHSHSGIIVEIVRGTNAQSYLELGIWRGDTVNKVAPFVRRCIGVDIKDNRTLKIGEFYEQTTDEFFKWFSNPIDVIFIDANHTFEQAKVDLLNSIKILSQYGVIFLHDTDPMEKRLLDPGYCGDSYKLIDYIDERMPEFECVTLPVTEAGLSIIKRKGDRRIYAAGGSP